MSKRPFDTIQGKMSRHDRFVQMSQQEMIIEQKKKEIQAKRCQSSEVTKNDNPIVLDVNSSESKEFSAKAVLNQYSNDGSFLDQFKQLNTKKNESKFKTFNKYNKEKVKEHEKCKKAESISILGAFNEDQTDSIEKNVPTLDLLPPSFECEDQHIMLFDSSFTSPPPQLLQNHFSGNQIMETGNELMAQPPPAMTAFSTIPHQSAYATTENVNLTPITATITQQVGLVTQNISDLNTNNFTAGNLTTQAVVAHQIISASSPVPTVLLNVPPPQTQIAITPEQNQNVLVATATRPHIVELTSIPPPNPIQIRNIPQPEPLNTLNIPPPPPIQLCEIPNPKPLDLMAIPAPAEIKEDNFINANILRSIPPPNKNLPPPNVIGDVNYLANQTIGASIPLTSPAGIPSLMSQRVLPPPGMVVSVPPPPNFTPLAPPPAILNVNVPPPAVTAASSVATLNRRGNLGNENSGDGDNALQAMTNLARMVAECGSSIEDLVRQKKNRDPELWFLFHKDSSTYREYVNLIDQFKKQRDNKKIIGIVKSEATLKHDGSEKYEPEMALEDDSEQDCYYSNLDYFKKVDGDAREEKEEDSQCLSRKERKRKSRWGDRDETVIKSKTPLEGSSMMLTKVTRSDTGLLQYALQSYGSTVLSEEDWKKAKENYKIHLLYQDMMKKKAELESIQRQGRNKYEYDSDEEIQGGTWEHKLRDKEMQATEKWADELTRQSEGKHHIGDFLPPEELKRFLEKSDAIKEGRQPNLSDYKEFKIKEDNIGFKMLQKLGWTKGQGLGQNNSGIVDPVNKSASREHTQGLGLNANETTADEDEYESYRKRMMLAYRFRPNPLNNPRRPYY